MWTNYGIPNAEAIKIRFPWKIIIKWVKDFRNDKIGVYGVNSKGALQF